jgi:hypothetical protein
MENAQSQRDALKQALTDAGMTPTEFSDRQGKSYVVVPLLDTRTDPIIIPAEDPELRAYFRSSAKTWSYPAYLYICSGSTRAPWQVGVIGHSGHTDEDYTPDEWKDAATIEQAVEEFQGLWANRDALLNAFVGDRGVGG